MPQIRCCFNCLPPKRYPGCHDNCQEYRTAKAEWDAKRKPPVVADYIGEATQRYGAKHFRNPHKVRY